MLDWVKFADKKIAIGAVLFLMIQGYALKSVNDLYDYSYKLSTDYSYNVVQYGLSASKNKDEINKQIQEWQDKKWGAQIAAIKSLCNNGRDRLDD